MTSVLLGLVLAGGDDLAQFRRQMDAAIRVEEGWLAVAGLFWLREGTTTLGTDPANDLVLPKGSAPARLGWLVRREGEVSFVPEAWVKRGLGATPRFDIIVSWRSKFGEPRPTTRQESPPSMLRTS